jgi:hypothetical protein
MHEETNTGRGVDDGRAQGGGQLHTNTDKTNALLDVPAAPTEARYPQRRWMPQDGPDSLAGEVECGGVAIPQMVAATDLAPSASILSAPRRSLLASSSITSISRSLNTKTVRFPSITS